MPKGVYQRKPISEETRKKMSLSHLGNKINVGRKATEQTKENMRLAQLGRKHPDTVKLKISQSNKGRTISPIRINQLKESWKNPEYRTKMISICKNRKFSDESKIKIRQARLKQHIPIKNTQIERLIQDALTERGYAYYCHYGVTGQPDIAFPDQKIAIFLDGCYWHECDSCGYKNSRANVKNVRARDSYANNELNNDGWLILRYWEHEIRANPEAVVDEIEDNIAAYALSHGEFIKWFNGGSNAG